MVKEATSLKLEQDLMEKVRDQARKENRSLNNCIETILLEYYNNIEKEKKTSD